MESKIIIQVTKEGNEELFHSLAVQDTGNFITVNDKWSNIYENDLLLLDIPQNLVEIAIKSPVCPCCGRKITRGLIQDYRDNGGCLGKKIVCGDCRYLADKEFWKLYCADEEEKLLIVLSYLSADKEVC